MTGMLELLDIPIPDGLDEEHPMEDMMYDLDAIIQVSLHGPKAFADRQELLFYSLLCHPFKKELGITDDGGPLRVRMVHHYELQRDDGTWMPLNPVIGAIIQSNGTVVSQAHLDKLIEQVRAQAFKSEDELMLLERFG
ncbi:hypothetical protein RGQ15_10395 [Paracoccus sp. MBLB3053]|uniref:Uncharacterized protein n=1 Tax=Paracoccus aurantius TaxID=3073814 RepID=A0ABU2HUN3_9RHOB|nr:hypothetical protein [Paracoccus sp. MBLB3053]MDS9467974.1 hypothetical protein [Paracoccus sp. MBLB3053]